MQQQSQDRARRLAQSRYNVRLSAALECHEKAKKLASGLHKGWSWVEQAEGEERERREAKWLERLTEYERQVNEVQKIERELRDMVTEG